jgi:predicted kinase
MANQIKPERQIVMLIGLPGAGKSTYIREHAEELKVFTIVSIDGIAQERSKGTGLTGTQVHDKQYDSIVKEFADRLDAAVKNGDNILIEGVNATLAKRSARLAGAKNSEQYDYKTKAIVINPPSEQVRMERIWKRAVSEHRVSFDGVRIEMPKKGEFDQVEYIGAVTNDPSLYSQNGNPSVGLVELIKSTRESAKNSENLKPHR